MLGFILPKYDIYYDEAQLRSQMQLIQLFSYYFPSCIFTQEMK